MQTNDGAGTKPPAKALSAFTPPCPECGKPMHMRATVMKPDDISYVCIICAWRKEKPATLQG